MKCIINIAEETIGEADFELTDVSMGTIGGIFIPNENYFNFDALNCSGVVHAPAPVKWPS